MSYCSENNTFCDRTRFFTSMGATPAGWVQVPIFSPGTIPVAALQVAINRIQPSYPDGAFRLLTVDGKLGSATQGALDYISRAELAALNLVTGVAMKAGPDAAMTALHSLADQRGLDELQLQPVGPFAPGDKSAPPQPPAGTKGLPAPLFASTTAIVVVAVGVGVALALLKKKGRKR